MNYLYNGVELPALPESELPNAYITHSLTNGSYLLFASDNKAYRWEEQNVVAFFDGGKYKVYLFENDNWAYKNEVEFINSATISDDATATVIWANSDIYSRFGESVLYLAASDPIPVSSFTPDPISMTMGWLVGRRIAGQRGKGE